MGSNSKPQRRKVDLNLFSEIMKSFVVVLLLLSSSLMGQNIKLLSGNLKPLKNEKAFDIVFRYDSMLVGSNIPEKTYLMQKRKQWEEKEEGSGPELVKRWFEYRADRYEPTFIKNFQSYHKVTLPDSSARYTLILKTKRTEGGWYGGVMAHPAEIDGELWIVESADKAKVVARIGFSHIGGKDSYGGDFEMFARINSAYEIAGKALGDFVRRKSK